MPASLTDLLNGRRTITVSIHGHDIEVTYRPGYLTPKTTAKLAQLSDQSDDNGVEAQLQTFVGLVEKWDLLGDDGKPVPITSEALNGIPFVILNQIAQRCYEDMQPGKRK